MKFLNDIRLLLLGLWLGGSVFFIAVAQVAFSILPERELAGAIVGRSLTVLNFSGMALATLILLMSFITTRGTNAALAWIDRLLILIVAIACAVGQFVIGYMISSARSQMGGRKIDEFAIDDPLRIQFNQAHEYSVWVLAAAMIAGLIAFFVIANRRTIVARSSATNDPYNFEKEFKI
ncbi:MAG: DUF4149 domain-containing protein [bacterium]|nr:DUF4149 domain-containing protein [bacterium]